MRRPFANDIHYNEPGPDPDLPDGYGARPRQIAASSYTLGAADDMRELLFACTQDTTVAIPAPAATDTRLDIFVVRDGPGALTITAPSGVKLDAPPEASLPLKLAAPGNGASLTRVGPTTWRVVGDFTRTDD